MMGRKPSSGASTNDASKQFSTGMCNRKSLQKVTAILHFAIFLSSFDIVLLIMVAHNGGTQIKGLYELVLVTKGKLFGSY